MAKNTYRIRGKPIMNDVKRFIVLNLCETGSMDLIAREHCVSPTSVARILRLTLKMVEKRIIFLGILTIYLNSSQ